MSQAPLQCGFASLAGRGPHQQARHGEPLCPYRTNACRDPERDGGERLTRLGTGVFSRTPLQTRTPEASQVTGHGALAPMPVGLPAAIVLDDTLPGGQEPRGVPAPIREGGPGPPHGRRTEPEIGECGDERAATLEQPPTEQRPQEVEKAQIGTHGHVRDHTRQHVIDTVE